jgi:hypothetical protein
MRIGIYDGDIYQPNSKSFPNLEAMKLASYHKNRGDLVELINYPTTEFLEKFDKIYIRKDKTRGKIDKKVLSHPKVEYGGLFFTNNIFVPMEKEIERLKPDTTLYFPFLRYKFSIGKITDKEIEHFIDGVYARLFYEDGLLKPAIRKGQHVTLYDQDITSHNGWAKEVADIFEQSGRKVKIMHPVIARTIEDLIYLCEEKPFFSDRPTKIVVDMEIIEDNFKEFILQYKGLLQKYGGQMLFIYINKFYNKQMPYKEYILSMLNKVFLARSEGVKLNLLFLPSDFYNPYDKIMSTMADWFYMQPNISFYDKVGKTNDANLKLLIDEIAYSQEGKNIFFVNLGLIKQGGTWNYEQGRIRERD